MQYSSRECLDISANHSSVKDNELETKVIDILEESGAPW